MNPYHLVLPSPLLYIPNVHLSDLNHQASVIPKSMASYETMHDFYAWKVTCLLCALANILLIKSEGRRIWL